MKIQDYNIKGIKSVFLPDIHKWQFIEYSFKFLIKKYIYKEIKLPIIEKQELFKKTLGKYSNILKKEMFSFKDKNNQIVTLIPEGTASCTKELILADMIRNFQKINVWYMSPMFRRENPQKGRNRLFYQIGLESFGFKDYGKEVEHIFIFNQLFKLLNVNDIILEINCIDNLKNTVFKRDMLNFFISYISNFNLLKKNLFSNPLSLLEKLKFFSNLNIPCQLNYLSNDVRRRFIFFLYTLKKIGIYFVFNKFLVRGLDYYNAIVYEWTTLIDKKKLAICSGGRYDSLSKLIGKYESFSTGCAAGIDRLSLKIKLSDNFFSSKKVFFNLDQPLHINFKFFDFLSKKNDLLECNEFGFDFKKKIIKGLKGNFFLIDKKFIKNEIN
ncbi:MAG TPA: ATP phosphoribosyltransferase regulatory subunit [Candidatus Azoamicus sp.]